MNVKSFADLYGEAQLVYNVHSLLHVVDDVKNFGPLDAFSAFSFESHMYKIKKMIRRNNNPLAQLCNRVGEIYMADSKIKQTNHTGFEINKPCRVNSEIFFEICMPGYV